ncbi:MAG TPA: hypothetical protein VML94_05430 [Thermoplasmata archaeon]|nr:hypothetical protein [Thermoplasmata archaeon]
MNIPIDIPGLDSILPQISEGTVVVVEGSADAAKGFFVRHTALTAGRKGQPVTFVTSRDRDELRSQLLAEQGPTVLPESWVHIDERDSVEHLEEFGNGGGLLAIDSFSFLTLDLSPDALAHSLRALRNQCRAQRTTAVLGTDRGMFGSRSEAIAVHLADGFLQFHTREAADGVQRFLRVPKWMDGRFVDRNVYYEFDGKRLAIDLRSRVL